MKILNQNEKRTGSLQAAKLQGENAGVSECSSENKTLSHPFRDAETGGEPCLSLLFALASFIPGIEDTASVQRVLSVNDNMRYKMGDIRKSRMSPEDRQILYDSLDEIRKETSKLLDFLVKYDDQISSGNCHLFVKAKGILDQIRRSQVTITEEPIPGVPARSQYPDLYRHLYIHRGGVT